MANPITRGFSKLTQFDGRDTRNEFWPYVGVVFAVVMVVGGIAGAVIMNRIVSTVAVDVAASVPTYPILDFRPFFLVQAGSAGLFILLAAAAVSRRLHDRNIPGWWGLAPVPFIIFGLFAMQALMGGFTGDGTPNLGLFGLMFVNNIVYLVTLVTLIIFLAQPGTPGANRYGPARATANEPRPVDDWTAGG